MPAKSKRIGKLTILKDWRQENVRKLFTVCDCGNFNLFVVKRQLTRKSCGCLTSESIKKLVSLGRKPQGEAAFNEVYAIYTRSAKLRGHLFDMSKEDFKVITSQNCYYCDSPPSNKILRRRSKENYTYSGLDRVDNALGYQLDNVVPCCITCNEMKMCMGQDEFVNHLRQMMAHHDLMKNTHHKENL